jgi:hypothetical protein
VVVWHVWLNGGAGSGVDGSEAGSVVAWLAEPKDLLDWVRVVGAPVFGTGELVHRMGYSGSGLWARVQLVAADQILGHAKYLTMI